MRVPIEAGDLVPQILAGYEHHPLKMRVPIEAHAGERGRGLFLDGHHPLKMRVPIEALGLGVVIVFLPGHHPLKMRVPIEAR